ncbi:MAG: AAA family ATPase [Candidatus Cyclonatronum sp.]|uniref:AAA family ATPase n=1 Tax=Cyclonatronum sp. TaxID=3024185 RepID=UPI0025C2CEAE|nr:AAA family ATPase [Cyclonatronum sp.]MCH8487213.1 AAA family ATPase [Cyclonatronum sp.]
MSIVVPYADLTNEQKKIVSESTDKRLSYWIDGPPGSGKTTISLHIANMIVGQQVVTPLVLIYNNSLSGYLKSSFKELGLEDNVTIATKDKFFWNLAEQKGVKVPYTKDYLKRYSDTLEALLKTELIKTYDIAILDEIQDFQKGEWEVLKKLVTRFIVLGDFDQGIYKTNLGKADLNETCHSRMLEKIFRFSRSLAGLLAALNPLRKDLQNKVDRESDVQPVIIDTSEADVNEKIRTFINARKADGGRIAAITIGRARLKQLHDYLEQRGVEHFYTDKNQEYKDHDFAQNTPVLLTAASAKGLEFETVIAFGFEDHDKAVWSFRTYGGLMENLYVCLSRAKEYLYIIRTPNTIPEIKKLIVETPDSANATDDDDDDFF